MTTVRSVTLNADDANAGFAYRDRVSTLIAGSLGQVRVTFQASLSNGALAADHASIGVASGSTTTTTATPIELLFSGAHGFSIAQNATITSDWVNLSFLSTDSLVVLYDINSGSSGGTRNNVATGNVTDIWWSKAATASYNIATEPGSPTTNQTSALYGISLIETQAGGVVVGPIVLGPGGTSIFRAKQFASMGRRQIYG